MLTQQDKVKGLIADIAIVAVDEVKAEDMLIDQLGIDSLDCVELTMSLEEEFGIEIPDEIAEKCLTVQSVYDLIEKLTGEVKDEKENF